MNQYFTLFQLEPRFDIDTASLEQTYHTLAARFHPDKFAATSAFEQKQAMMMSSAVNEAYRILKSPIDRAAYLLKQHNIDADAPEHTSFAAEFLMQQMEWRETLEDARAQNDEAALAALDAEIRHEQTALQQNLQTAFAQTQYEQAAALVRQGRFLNKLRQEIYAAQA
ncbi:Fe-S protein assembly co-chaperone HscB [Uruburuella testudinis]|uniref:Co-chaperone protein HscB homolog n=1 Tax=Uruburuella testudinis TaxID=1282863 RepID=A0ABY4DQ64_9NEIS|nr:Fe-S protein assembly co-chaperone HscB [Uruburuella testudinis]UOO81098.1 Fe-S protein assembly co-chaperone HscB [Uruburuella testudinis]